MPELRVFLLGPLRIQRDGRILHGLEAGKAQELLCYLLLHPGRAFPREALAEQLWADASPVQSRKVLRQAIWQLRAAIDPIDADPGRRVLTLAPGVIGLDTEAGVWCDAVELEQLGRLARDVPGRDLDEETVAALERAVALYRGDLLEGWYQDWCLHRRELLQNQYLQMLVRLMGYWEARGVYENSMAHGARILEHEPAHERTHRRLMRLHYLAGDRTAALRQYRRCTDVLRDELGVAPSRRTTLLYQQIRADQVEESTQVPPGVPISALEEQLRGLRELLASAASVQSRLQRSLEALQLTLATQQRGGARELPRPADRRSDVPTETPPRRARDARETVPAHTR